MTPAAGRGVRHARVRCAIYTRKSSEEGLDQQFNSLQAQRQPCEAFINSQRHEGWVCLPAAFDDGGFSGATMERPALQRLLADITAGRVDIVVVYNQSRAGLQYDTGIAGNADFPRACGQVLQAAPQRPARPAIAALLQLIGQGSDQHIATEA